MGVVRCEVKKKKKKNRVHIEVPHQGAIGRQRPASGEQGRVEVNPGSNGRGTEGF